MVEYGLKANHALSLAIGVAWSCLVFLWAGRDEECSRLTAMLEVHVERHGIATWHPVATFCRGALASSKPTEATRESSFSSCYRTGYAMARSADSA